MFTDAFNHSRLHKRSFRLPSTLIFNPNRNDMEDDIIDSQPLCTGLCVEADLCHSHYLISVMQTIKSQEDVQLLR